METVRSRLDGLPPQLGPLADCARGLLTTADTVSADGVIRIGHRPWVAPENYAITLYPGLPAEALDRYAGRFGLSVPPTYADFLGVVNGAYCYGMALAGVPLSMLGSHPLLDRTVLQCQDLGLTAGSAAEYRKLPAEAVCIGWRHYSYRENVGHFVVGGRVLSIRKNGRVVGEWDGLAAFLAAEIGASRALDADLYPAPPTGG